MHVDESSPRVRCVVVLSDESAFLDDALKIGILTDLRWADGV